eukprot:6041603-Pleurochrysis_carterae.AAC.3
MLKAADRQTAPSPLRRQPRMTLSSARLRAQPWTPCTTRTAPPGYLVCHQSAKMSDVTQALMSSCMIGSAAVAVAKNAGSSCFNASNLTCARSGGTFAKASTPAGVRCIAAHKKTNAQTTRHTCALTTWHRHRL